MGATGNHHLKELSQEVSADWETMGLLLKIKEGVLNTINTDYPSNTQRCFVEMLKEWLKQVDPPPVWSTIIDAIELLGNPSLAEKLRVQYT